MTGRYLFAKTSGIINRISACLKIMPPPFLKFLFSATRNIRGKFGIALRYVLLKAISQNIGSNVSIREGVIIIEPQLLHIGTNVSVHPNCYIDASGSIKIGNDVSIATASILISDTHTWGDPNTPIKYNPILPTPIEIDDDVWVACNCKIIGPCHIHNRTIVAAGAVVKGEVGPQCIVGGIPAKEIKKI